MRQLTDAGVTIEIADAARRRVQAHLPVSRLTAVAQLARRRRDPAADLRAARAPATSPPKATRSCTPTPCARSSALDGTGVRVGVISDGIKGIFATGCTTACAGVDGGPIATGDLPTAAGTRTAAGVLTASTGGIVGRSFSANGDLEGLPPAIAGLRVRRRRRRGHGAARDRARPRARREAVVRQRRHRSRVQPGRELPRRVERRRARRHRLLRRAVRRHQRGVGEHGGGAQQPELADSRVRHVGRATTPTSTTTAPTSIRAWTARRSPASRRRGTCTCSSARRTRPTCSASARSRTT